MFNKCGTVISTDKYWLIMFKDENTHGIQIDAYGDPRPIYIEPNRSITENIETVMDHFGIQEEDRLKVQQALFDLRNL